MIENRDEIIRNGTGKIQQIHKKLHGKEVPKKMNNNNNNISRITINEVKKYLGEPLPLPYLIKSPTKKETFKPNKLEFNHKLKNSIIRLKEKETIDQCIQTDNNELITSKDQMKEIVKKFHENNSKDIPTFSFYPLVIFCFIYFMLIIIILLNF